MRSRQRRKISHFNQERNRIMNIETTKNYDMFKTMKGNRGINDYFVKKMVKNIREYGLINPIVVTENMEVIDGQHRLEALKILGMPVQYIINSTVLQDAKTVQEINRVQHKWTQYDRVKSLADTGNGTCKWILLMFKDHDWMGVQSILSLLRLDSSALSENLLINLDERARTERKLEYLDKYAEIFKDFKGRKYAVIACFAFLYDHTGVDNDRLLKVAQEARYDWIPCSSSSAAMKQIEALYNKGLRGNRLSLAVDYDNYCRASVTKGKIH